MSPTTRNLKMNLSSSYIFSAPIAWTGSFRWQFKAVPVRKVRRATPAQVAA